MATCVVECPLWSATWGKLRKCVDSSQCELQLYNAKSRTCCQSNSNAATTEESCISKLNNASLSVVANSYQALLSFERYVTISSPSQNFKFKIHNIDPGSYRITVGNQFFRERADKLYMGFFINVEFSLSVKTPLLMVYLENCRSVLDEYNLPYSEEGARNFSVLLPDYIFL